MSKGTAVGNSVPVSCVQLQFEPRLDSLFAYYLLCCSGNEKYPGIRKARIECVGTGMFSQDGKTWQDQLKVGVLQIGVGGGPFDEHPSPDFGDRKAEGLSATLLVARDLGLEKHPVYKHLIQIVNDGDQTIGKTKDTWGTTIKAMHRAGRNLDLVIDWLFAAIDATLDCQRDFLNAQRELQDPDLVRTLFVQGSDRQIVCVQSESRQILAAARSLKKEKLAFLIVARESGHIQIFGNAQSGSGVAMGNIPAAIRYEELLVRGNEQLAEELRPTLGQEGALKDVPQWYLQDDLFMNGSESARNIERTRIERKRIAEIVRQRARYVAPVTTKEEPVSAKV